MKDMLSHKGYYGSVNFDEDEMIFHGKIEFIRSLASYEATTARDLKKAFKNSVADYLATCEANDIEPEKPFKGSLNIRLGSDLHRKVALLAVRKQKSLNRLICGILERAIV